MTRVVTLIQCALAVLVFSCTTPTIPLPPPEVEAIEFTLEEGWATFRYTLPKVDYANARVFIMNEDLGGKGIVAAAAADGSVPQTQPFQAAVGHRIQVIFARDAEPDESSARVCVVFRPGSLTDEDFCR
ncbi:MAG: hypothetical protein HY698_01160 [Deltaproteobacteria bacterium]|nr:hypothetical protein [Deltaproteobacteria bacterium]